MLTDTLSFEWFNEIYLPVLIRISNETVHAIPRSVETPDTYTDK